jgi:hypothetical protein
MCQYYKCFFFDSSCSEKGIMESLGNFTIRLNDSLGYTIAPEIYLRDGFYDAGENLKFKACDLQIYGNFAD